MTVATAPRVELQGLSKRFGNVLAVDNVSLSIAAGTVHALVGANGAGKSTLGKIIGGCDPPGRRSNPGRRRAVQFAIAARGARQGRDRADRPGAGARAGSDGDGEHLSRRRAAAPRVRRCAGAMTQQLSTQLARAGGFELERDALVGELRTADQQKVEILRAVAAERERDRHGRADLVADARRDAALHEMIRALRAGGTTIVLRQSTSSRRSSRCPTTVTVLRNGRLVRTAPASAARRRPASSPACSGHAASRPSYPRSKPRHSGAPVMFEVDGLSRGGCAATTCRSRSRAGEIVGLAGLVGSGRTELARAIFGRRPHRRGTITRRRQGMPHPHAGRRDRVPGSRCCRRAARSRGSSWSSALAANTTCPSSDMRSVSARGLLRPARRARRRPGPCCDRPRRQPAGAYRSGRQPVGRQPAEGAVRASGCSRSRAC